ncbi:MAG TPA: hypothetical protein PLD59_09625 [Tepidisphaeraceae bacterium]|nr:hypothetical protein [Tepidisphaeraceae bacterium]
MSRIGAGNDVIPVRAGNNVYTVLLGVAVIVQAMALLAMFMKYGQAFTGYPFTMP